MNNNMNVINRIVHLIKIINIKRIIQIDKIIKCILITLIILGIFQSLTIIEETFHVIHGKGAKSVCLDFNLKLNDSLQNGYLIAHTVFNPTEKYENVSEYYTWREQSEKMTYIGKYIFLIICSGIIGYSIKVINDDL